jgi:hypothetical protein
MQRELTDTFLLQQGFEHRYAEHCEHFVYKNLLVEILPDNTIHLRLEFENESVFIGELKTIFDFYETLKSKLSLVNNYFQLNPAASFSERTSE